MNEKKIQMKNKLLFQYLVVDLMETVTYILEAFNIFISISFVVNIIKARYRIPLARLSYSFTVMENIKNLFSYSMWVQSILRRVDHKK